MKSGPRIYNLFPTLLGPIDRWTGELPRIAAMGFDWVYVNPFHLTGYSGSLYAVKDYYTLNPLFRGAATGTDDELIAAFVASAAAAGVRVMMDLVVNHTARDSVLAVEHPDWFVRASDGGIASPSANDPANPGNVTVWTDLAELDYAERPQRAAAVDYFRAVVRHYTQLGIAGFRCDAAYKIPADVWAAYIAAARDIAPSTLFAAETLGAPLEAVTQLGPAGFDYLFNSSKWWDFRATWLLDQYEQFRHIAPSIAFPESHDTPRLATELAERSLAEIESEYRFRYLFAAFFSSGVMLPIGYEYGFDAPFDVVMTRPEHWQTPRFDISDFITAVNAMKAAIPALNTEGPERVLASTGDAIALVRLALAGSSSAVAVLNPDSSRATSIDADVVLRELAAPRDITPQRAPATELVSGAPIVLQPREMRIFTARDDAFVNGASGVAASMNGHAAGVTTGSSNVESAPAHAARDARPVIIENVWPQIDGGRYPVKRIVGDRFEVQADIFREGHDEIAAVLRYRESGAQRWREVPMRHFDNDRWRGSFVLERNTRYVYTIESWPDAFETWRHGAQKKYAAGQPMDVELDEATQIVAAARDRAAGSQRTRLENALVDIAQSADSGARTALLLGDAVAELMAATPDRSQSTVWAPELAVIVDRPAAQIGAWYELFPRSQGTVPGRHGTFADATRRLADVRAMGFDVVYLPPIHPIGHAFRKGPNNTLDPKPGDPGSPWAIGNVDGGHTAVEPALGTLDDFDRFVRAANALGLEIALDYALQCSPDHPYVREHPEWFSFRPDGTIKYAENPPKKYQDIVNFNWFGDHAPALWDELRDIVEFWVGHGVRIFRVDNPHTKPFAFWEWMIADVQSRHPDVLFLAEAFTRPKIMKQLAKLGFTQSYTYFTWRNFKGELTDYLNELAYSELGEYFRPNFFANTPDILPPFLQTGGRAAFVIRLVLAATLSSVYGIYSGYELAENAALPGREEYLDSEKYEIRVRDWDAPGNLKAEIARINAIRREYPALQTWRNVRFHRASDQNVIFFSKSAGGNTLLVAVNLDPFRAVDVEIELPLADLGYTAVDGIACEELIGGARSLWHGPTQTLHLDPQHNPAAIFKIDSRLHVDYESPSD